MRVRCPVMVGRSAQLSWLRAGFERAVEGRGAVVLIEGRPGVGKSRLVNAFMDEVRRGGAQVGVGVARAGSAIALEPLVEALLPLQVDQVDEAQLGPYGPALAALAPGPRAVSAASGGGSPVAVSALVVAEAIVKLVRHRAPEGFVLVVEDLHEADPDTVAVLSRLCRQAPRAPLLVAVTSRPVAGPARLSDQGIDVIALPSLGVGEVAEMVGACGLPTSTVVEAARGVPLLVEELLGAVDAGVGADHDVLRTLVRAQLWSVEADTRRILAAAALLDERFDVDILARAFPELDVSRHRDGAADAGLLERVGSTVRFRHALTRDAVVELTPADVRSEVGRRVLEVVGDQGARRAAVISEVVGDRGRAVALRLTAARDALARGLLGTAGEDLRRAAALGPTGEVRAELMLLQIECACAAGRLDDALSVAAEVFADHPDLVAADTVHRQLARAAAEAARWEVASVQLAAATDGGPECALVAARIQAGQGRLAQARDAALAVVGQAVTAGIAGQAWEIVGRCERSLGDAAAAAAAFEQAQVCAVRAHAPAAELSAVHELGTIDMLTTGRRDRLEAAARLAEALGDARLSAVIALQSVALYHMHGDAELTLACAGRAVDEADALGLTAMEVVARSFIATALALRGDLPAMESALADAERHGLRSDPDAHAGTYGSVRGLAALLREDRPAARDALERAAEIIQGAPAVRPQPWWGYWALVRAVDGHRDADAAIRAVRESPARICASNTALATLAEAVLLGRTGDRDGAHRRVEAVDEAALPWAWHYHLSRRLVAEAALTDGWGEPRRWLHDARSYFEDWYPSSVPGACEALLSTAAPPVPTWLADRGVTVREAEVLGLLRLGLRDRELAGRLFLSPRTVEKHVESLRRKLGVATRGELIALAARG